MSVKSKILSIQSSIFWDKVYRKINGKWLRFIMGTPLQFKVYRCYWYYRMMDKSNKPTCKRYITAVPNPGAGIGHQLANWNTALVLAEQLNLTFVHSPFGSKKWEDFLGFGIGEIPFRVLKKKVKVVKVPRFEYQNMEERTLVFQILSHAYPHQDICFSLERDQDIRPHYLTKSILHQKYFNRRKLAPVQSNYLSDKVNIAVHIRRGDISKLKDKKGSNWGERFLDNQYFINVLNNLMPLMEESQKIIHIFSQGSKEDFVALDIFPNVEWHLDEDVFTTFHHLCIADILITSPSSFSQKAALINSGIKLAKYPWWHDICDDKDWIRVDEHGNVDPINLKQPITEKFGRSKECID